MKAVKGLLSRNAILLLTALLLFPTLAYPPCGDLALFLVIGRLVREGAVLYQDAWDIKPPAIYMMYAIPAGNAGDLLEAWYRLRVFDCLINLSIALLAARTAVRLFGRAAGLPAVAWYMAILLSQGPGVLAQTEVWANVFTFGGLAWLLAPPPWSRWKRFLVLGLLAGGAAALKPALSWPLLAAVVTYPVLKPIQDKRPTSFIWPCLSLLAGFIVSGSATWCWLAVNGGLPALQELFDGFTRDYLAQGDAPAIVKIRFYLQAFAFQSKHMWPLLIWLLPGLIARNVCSRRQTLWILAIGLAGFGAMWTQGRALNYHYQVMTPGIVLMGTAGTLGIASLIRGLPRQSLRLSFAAALPVLLFHAWNNGVRDLTALRWLAGTETPETYAKTMDIPMGNPMRGDSIRAAQYIRANSKPEDKIIVWVNDSDLYVWANRMPANRFLQASGLVKRDAPPAWRKQYLLKLSAFPPEYFIVSGGSEYTWFDAPPGDATSQLNQWKDLRDLISARYAPPMNFGHLDLYRLKTSTKEARDLSG